MIFGELLGDVTQGATNSKGNFTKTLTDFAKTVLKPSGPLGYCLRAPRFYLQVLTQCEGKESLYEPLWQLLNFFICGEADPGLEPLLRRLLSFSISRTAAVT